MKYEELLREIKESLINPSFPPQFNFFPKEITSDKDFRLLKEKLRAAAGKYLIVDVWNLQPRLFIQVFDEDGSGISETVTDVPEELKELLEESVYDAGGALNVSGIYPLNQKAIAFLLKEADRV